MATFLGRLDEIKILSRYDIHEFIDKNYDVAVVHSSSPDIPEELLAHQHAIFIYGGVESWGRYISAAYPPLITWQYHEVEEKTIDIELEGGEIDIRYPRIKTYWDVVVKDRNGNIVAIRDINGNLWVCDFFHKGRKEVIEAVSQVIKELTIPREEWLKRFFKNKLRTVFPFEGLANIIDIKVDIPGDKLEQLANRYAMSVAKTMVEAKEAVLARKIGELQRKVEELKSGAISEVARLIGKALAQGWEIKEDGGRVWLVSPKITARYIKWRGKTVEIPEESRKFWVRVRVDIDWTGIPSRIPGEGYHPNLSRSEGACTGDLEGAPLSRFTELQQLYETINLDSAFGNDACTEAENLFEKLESKAKEVVWNAE